VSVLETNRCPFARNSSRKLQVVVHLAVKNKTGVAVERVQGWWPGLAEIEDREPPVSQSYAAIRPGVLAVGPAIRDHIDHGADRGQPQKGGLLEKILQYRTY